jgi:hypothetical protein
MYFHKQKCQGVGIQLLFLKLIKMRKNHLSMVKEHNLEVWGGDKLPSPKSLPTF